MNERDELRRYQGADADAETLSLIWAMIAVIAPTSSVQEAQSGLFKAALINFASLLAGDNAHPIVPKRKLTPAEREFLLERKEALRKNLSATINAGGAPDAQAREAI